MSQFHSFMSPNLSASLPTPARLAAFGDIAPLMSSASLRSSSATPPTSAAPASPNAGLRIIIVAGDALHVHDAADHEGNVCPVPVTTLTVMASVNVSVMTIMVRQLDRGGESTSKWLATPLRGRTACRARRAVSLGSPPSATSPPLTPSVSLALVVGTPGSAFASPVRACPSPAFALRRPPVSAPLSPPLHEPPAACSALLPSVPSAPTATQSPWRLPPARLARADFPSLIPGICRS